MSPLYDASIKGESIHLGPASNRAMRSMRKIRSYKLTPKKVVPFLRIIPTNLVMKKNRPVSILF